MNVSKQDTRFQDWVMDVFVFPIRCFLFSVDTQGWGVSPRGAGYLFGSDVVTQVCCKQRTTFYITVHIVLENGTQSVP